MDNVVPVTLYYSADRSPKGCAVLYGFGVLYQGSIVVMQRMHCKFRITELIAPKLQCVHRSARHDTPRS
jgi:hypothetical protein